MVCKGGKVGGREGRREAEKGKIVPPASCHTRGGEMSYLQSSLNWHGNTRHGDKWMNKRFKEANCTR